MMGRRYRVTIELESQTDIQAVVETLQSDFPDMLKLNKLFWTTSAMDSTCVAGNNYMFKVERIRKAN
jgi:hypothetical protein